MTARTEAAVYAALALMAVALWFSPTISKSIFMRASLYEDNNALGEETNREVKSLVLNRMKKEYSELESVFYMSIDPSFMDSVRKISDNKYTVIVQEQWPSDGQYLFTIEVIDGQYTISDFGIDP